MRKIDEISHDLALSLWNFTANYPGSSFKARAEKTLLEYKEWLSREEKWSAFQKDRSWDKLHTEIHCLLNDENKSAGEIADKTEELLRLFRYFCQSDANEKLAQVANYVETLRTK
jgi:hypothetical protein